MEVITTDGRNLNWAAPTAAEAIELAFPADPEPDADEPQLDPQPTSIFD